METALHILFLAAAFAYLGLTVAGIVIRVRKRLVPPAVEWVAVTAALLAAGARAALGSWGLAALWVALAGAAVVNVYLGRIAREYTR